MSTTRKPVPTDYCGTSFRSKSEAQFARWMHSLGLYFVYEPTWTQVDDRPPVDFAVGPTMVAGEFCMVRIVEYKPSEPTDSYMRDLLYRVLEIKRQFPKMFTVSAVCCWGSVYHPDQIGSAVLSDDRSVSPDIRWLSTSYVCDSHGECPWGFLFFKSREKSQAAMLDAKQFRFDLIQE